MKHRPLFFLAFSLTLVAVMLGAMRFWGGSADVASAHTSTGSAHVELDMNTGNGTGPCNPVDTTGDNTQGGPTYTVAVCLSDVQTGLAPQALQFALLYDDTLNQCVDTISCASPGACDVNGLNDNPNLLEANLDQAGAGWDCNLSNDSDGEPKCDVDAASGPGHGKAFIGCMAAAGPSTTVGNGITTAIALVSFNVIAGGPPGFPLADNMSLDQVEMTDSNLATFISCFPTGPCIGGTDNKTGGPTATATFTPIPATATATPVCGGTEQPACTPTPRAWTRTPTPGPTNTPGGGGGGGGGGEPTAAPPPPVPSGGGGPAVTPPATGTGSSGVDWTGILALTFAGAAAITFAAGGKLYLRRVKNR